MSEKASWGLGAGDEIVPGRYVLERLGGGKTFEAYVAWDEEMYATVVAKVLRPDKVDAESHLHKLTREWDTLRSLDHPVIMRAFQAVVDGPRPHLVLEYLEGPTLASVLKHGPLEIEQLLPLAVHVCSALHYMANREIVHLDVKPSNIVMGMPPRLIDLGIARSIEAANEVRKPIGTRRYMAPEQCRPGELGRIGSPADMWGLGVTLYRAASKRRPYPSGDRDADDVIERYPQLRGEVSPLPSHVPRDLAEVVMSCLAFEPEDRPTAADLAGALEPMLERIPTQPRLRRRRPRLR